MTTKTLNKEAIIDKLVRENEGMSKYQVRVLLDSFFEIIQVSIKEDTRVSIAKFGIFRRKVRRGRTYSNPQTRELMTSKTCIRVVFKGAKLFNDKIN